MSGQTQRRLAAIVFMDVVGYSRMIGPDEAGTLAALRTHRVELIDPLTARHGGRVVKAMGDGLLLEFPSIVNAVKCAIEVQEGMAARNADVPKDRRIRFRVGINLGDIVIDGEDIHGDGVNVAARLEQASAAGGLALSGVAHDSLGRLVDAAFEDGGEQRFKNIARPVRVWHWRPAAPPGGGVAAAPESAPAAASGGPSIAVLPFSNMSGDPEQEHFCDGLVEDIITTLSKLAGLRVIARNSSFVYKGRAVDVREAAEKLGVRYLLEGSVRKSGGRVRITVQLVDSAGGAHLWAERYDRSIEDIFAIQDEITLTVATELQVKLTEGEQARLRYTTTSNVEAWTCWVQGLSHYRKAITEENMTPARRCWEKALALDPGSAALNAMLGFLHAVDARFGWWDERETALGKALGYVERGLALEPDNADAHVVSSLLSLLRERFDDAVREARLAVALAPGSADVAELASFVLAPSGFPEEALRQSKKAIALNPNHPPVYLGQLGNACHLSGRLEEAIEAFEAYGARSPGFGLVDLVIIHQQNGRPEEARRAAERLLAARPAFTIAAWRETQFRRDKARLRADLEALRAAGLPAG